MLENEIANLSDIFGMDEKNILAHIRGRKLTVKQTAKMLNVQPRCVYDMISEGELIAFRLKNVLRVFEISVVSYIARKIII